MIEPASILCPCGCDKMARIGEDVSGRPDVIPAQFQVLVARRPGYACRRCSQAVVQAHAPEHVVPGGLPTERLIARIIVSKFGATCRSAARPGSSSGRIPVSTAARSAAGPAAPACT